MKRTAAMTLCLLLVFSFVGCGKKAAWNGKTAEIGRLTMVADFTDNNVYVGMVDYVFVGTVVEIVDDTLPSKINGSKDCYSTYRIHVDKNLKGNLTEEIICSKLGGFKKDGTMYLVTAETPSGAVVADNGLPELNQQYVFMAYAQRDGSLTLSEIFDNRECTDEIIDEYVGYIDNEIVFERERYVSKYDLNEQQTLMD